MKTIFTSIFFGIILSLALFWLMQIMISNNHQGLIKTENIQMTEFVRLKRDTKLQTKDRNIPDKPPPPEKRPPPPKMQMQQAHISQNKLPNMDMPNLDIPLQTSRFSGSLIHGIKMGRGEISTNEIPLACPPPRYPIRAKNRSITGWVKVEFTITKQGAVKDVIVLDAQPSNIFNRNALQTITRCKFKPKIIGGEAIELRAEQIIEFTLPK